MTCTVRAPVFARHQFFGTSEHYGEAHGSLLSGWMNYNYTACCWFPTSSNILILPSQFWQIRFESCWLHCSKCLILVLKLRYVHTYMYMFFLSKLDVKFEDSSTLFFQGSHQVNLIYWCVWFIFMCVYFCVWFIFCVYVFMHMYMCVIQCNTVCRTVCVHV